MSKKSGRAMPSPNMRVLLALILPVIGSIVFSAIATAVVGEATDDAQRTSSLQLAGIGITTWFMGLIWYRLPGMGLRGHRALYAGIGFAVLAWVAFFIIRFATVAGDIINVPNSGQTFFYLLLFEAFCTQLWAFGLFFRAVADWRGPLTAAITSGILFGTAAFLLFEESFNYESFLTMLPAFIYFVTWGILYGVIRLRTGGLIGMVIVQALHSWTAWQLLVPVNEPDPSQLGNLYLISTIVYLIIIWRLWPKKEEDYRV